MKKILLITYFLLFSANICFAAARINLQPIYNALVNAGQAAALLAIIWGGVRYVLSIGNPGLAAEARIWVISGFTGLAIIVCANLIITKVTGKSPVLEVTGEVIFPTVPPEEEGPGIHFYSDTGCTTEISLALRVQSIKIINDEDKDREFVVILKSDEDECKVFSSPGCHRLNFSPTFSYVHLFNREAEGKIELFRRPYYLGKKYKLTNKKQIEEIELSNLQIKDGEKADGGWECEHLYEPDAYCFGSLKISGLYTLLLFNEEKGTHNIHKCEVYRPQLIKKEWGGAERNVKIHRLFSQSKPFKITIIPIKTY